MQPPKALRLNGTLQWQADLPYLIAYTVWASQDLMSPNAIREALARNYGKEICRAHVSNLIADLMAKGTLIRWGRGRYIHKDAINPEATL